MQIITGMHRSGTSLVARLLLESGADMGDKRTFYPRDQWNADGYYEQPEIHAVNMPLIHGPWWKFSYFFLPSEKTILHRARKMKQRISETAQKYNGKIVKETRFCLTLPAWLDYGSKITGILICLRDPIQVASSIQKRNHIGIGRALDLWRIHYERLLNSSHGIPRWFVYYNNILNPQSGFTEISPAFEFFNRPLSKEQWSNLSTKYVKPQMNHHALSSYVYPENVRSLWEQLLSQHQKQFNPLQRKVSSHA